MKKVLFTKEVNVNSFPFRDKIQVETISCIAFDYLDFSWDYNGDESFIFTSVNGVKAFFNSNKQEVSTTEVFCVGQKTKRCLESHGVKLKCAAKNVESLQVALKDIAMKGKRFVHFCGNLAMPVFRSSEVDYQQKHIYNTVLLCPEITDIYDAYVFFSPSGVRSFMKRNTLGDAILFSIGDTTTKTLRKYTKNTIFTSSKNTLEDLVELMHHQLVKNS